MSMWSRRRLRLKKLARQRLVIACEPLEGRALMASLQMIAPPPQVTPSIQVQPKLVSQVQTQNPALYAAFETFLTDLATAIHSPAGLEGASATLSNDVQAILTAAPSTTSQAATSLSNDVTTVTTSGALTSSSATVLSTDLTTVLSTAIAPPSGSSASGSGSGTSSVAAPATSSFLSAAAASSNNPNALSTALSDVARAQDDDLDASGTNVVDATTTTTATPAKKAALGQLLGDLSAIFAKANTLTTLSKADLRADFVAISAVAHQPSAQSVSTLQNHITQFTAGNTLNAANVTTLTNDLSAVLTSAGVSSRLVDRTQLDLGQVLASPEVLPSDVSTILNDLTNVLLNLPAASAVPAGPASWFLGKTPFSK